MQRYVVRRLLWIMPVLILISLITFGMAKATPGGPFDTTAGGRELPAQVTEMLSRRFHLNEPHWKQYLIYMGLWPTAIDVRGYPCPVQVGPVRILADRTCHYTFKGVLQGDLGPSTQFRDRGVTEILFSVPAGRPWWESRFGRTAQLGIFAFSFGVLLGIPLGVLAAVRHNSWLDYSSLFVATVFVATPSFVLAILLMIVFGLWLHWVPIVARSWDVVAPWLLPSFCLGVGLAALVARLTRSTMLEVLRQDYIRTAKAKGLQERAVMVHHALRNAMIPVATVLGPALAALITGSFFIEYMFSFPGMGRLFVQAINARDYSMILGTTLLYSFIIALANLAVDLVYAWLDPRISYS